MEIIKTNTKIDFIGFRRYVYVVSLAVIAFAIYQWIARGPDKYGIDFRGGDEIVVGIGKPVQTEELAKELEKNGLSGASVQSFEVGSTDYSIRVGLQRGMDTRAVRAKVEETLKSVFGDDYKVLKTDSVGATIGDELKRKALWAVILGLVLIVIYVTVRFEFSFALGALVAVFHDVLAALGVYLWAGHDLNGSALAAALTIVGYSVNDTIVIFDRVREEMRKHRDIPLKDILNDSINFCLSRTVITTVLTLFAVFALLMLGGGAIQDLSLFLFAGMISGVLSTIYVASPIVLWWEGLKEKRALRRAARA